MKKFLRGTAIVVLISFAAASFSLAFVLLLEDKAASATVAATMGFGAIILILLPNLEHIEVFSLKIKLRERIAEADELLSKLKATAGTLTAVSIMNNTYANRWGGMPYKKQAEVLDKQIALLREMDVSEDEIAQTTRPALLMIRRDLAGVLAYSLERTLKPYLEELSRRHDLAAKAGVETPEFKQAKAALEGHDVTEMVRRVHDLPNDTTDIAPHLKQALHQYELSEPDRTALLTLVDELAAANDAMWREGRMVEQIEQYQVERGSQKVYDRVFPSGAHGPNPS